MRFRSLAGCLLMAGVAQPALAQTGLGSMTPGAETPPAPSTEPPQLQAAPDGTAPADATAADATAVDTPAAAGDIVVTAQRREERLQDVPISITAINTEALQKKGGAGTGDLTTLVPGLVMGKSATVVTPYLRGVGTANLSPGSDPSVPVYIDGVYISAPAALFFSFNNIERVEVLKGPQGTLFGRNSTGGLIQVVTRDPKPGFSGRVSAGYGNYDTRQLAGYVTGGSDNLSADLAVIFNNQRDGYGKNVYVDRPGALYPAGASHEAGWLNEKGIRSKVKFTSDNTQARLSLLYTETRGNQGSYRRLLPGSVGLGGYRYGDAGEGFYDYNSDVQYFSKNQLYLGTAEITHDAGIFSVKSISSYLDSHAFYLIPQDNTPNLGPTGPTTVNTQSFTQELQLLSNKGNAPDWLQWIVGAYYLTSRTGFEPVSQAIGDPTGTNPGQGVNRDNVFRNRNESIAGFAQATITLPAEFQFTAGGRFTHDRYSADFIALGRNPNLLPTTGIPAGVNGVNGNAAGVVTQVVQPGVTGSKNSFTWRLALDKHFTRDIMVYASANRGFKSGGFNSTLCTDLVLQPTCRNIAPAVNPETLLAFEVGVRSDLFDRLLRLNVSAFHYKYDNLQIQSIVGDPPVSFLANAASAKIKGIEFDATLRPVRNLTFTASGSFLDTKYSSFPTATGFFPQATGGNLQRAINASGNELTRAPKFSGNLSADWVVPTSIGEFDISGSLYHTDRFFYEPQNRLVERGYELLNAQIAYRPTENLQLRVWGKNLTKTKYYVNQFTTQLGDAGTPGAPRTYGATVDYSF